MYRLLQAIFHPSTWLQNHEYSEEWDLELRYLMSRYPFTEIDFYTAKLGNVVVWIENHPYASFHRHGDRYRPRRSTILQAYKKLQKDRRELWANDLYARAVEMQLI